MPTPPSAAPAPLFYNKTPPRCAGKIPLPHHPSSFPRYPRHSPFSSRPRVAPDIPASPPVIPAKAGIQTAAAKPAARNQASPEASGSLLPLREKARMRVSRAPSPRRLRPSLPPETKRRPKAVGSLLPLWAYKGRLTLNSMGLSLRRRSDWRPSFPRKRESR